MTSSAHHVRWIREEAAMAAMTFDAVHQAEQVRAQLEAALASLRQMLDAFVSYRMRLVVAAAEHSRPRRGLYTPAAVEGRAMIAEPLTGPGVCRRQEAGEPATDGSQFRPLDPGIVSDAIPAFFIGRNAEGFWVAREAKAKIGGLFLFRNSALSFARNNSQPTGCATVFPAHRFELDLENKGNALLPHLGSLKRLVTRQLQRMAALIAG
jgi:hypothetical protein